MGPIRNMFARTCALVTGLGLSIAMASSCVSEPLGQDEAVNERESSGDLDESVAPLEGRVNGTLLHKLAVDAGHALYFYGLDGDGSQVVFEIMQEGDTALMDGMGDQSTLAELYTLARPGRVAPKSLQDSDARLARMRFDALAKVRPERDLAADAAAAKLAAKALLEAPEIETLAAGSCSGDAFGDLWGAQWFHQNFCHNTPCPSGYVPDGFSQCTKNSFLASRTSQGSRWVRFTQMEGDFNVAGRNIGRTQNWPYPNPRWDIVIHPRTIVTVGMNAMSDYYTNTIDGSSPCGHLHRAYTKCVRD